MMICSRANFIKCAVLAACLVIAAGAAIPQAAPVPTAPYSVSVFAQSADHYSVLDSITYSRTNVFVGYGNGGAPDGSHGAMSTIVEYTMDGKLVKMFDVVGHNDGLRMSTDGNLWALQNEDANANLVLINPATGQQTIFQIGTGPHGGGYDDIVFDGNVTFLSASNPSNNPNTAAAIVSAVRSGKNVIRTPVLKGDASALDVTTGKTVTLNLQDPDSMILDPRGELVLDSQSDGELVIVQHPGLKCQKALVVPLTSEAGGSTPGATTVDDTVFATAATGMLLVADKKDEKIYKITAPYFAPDFAYSAAVATTPTKQSVAFVGRLDLTDGYLAPVVSGLTKPGGMAFIPADADVDATPLPPDEEAGECP